MTPLAKLHNETVTPTYNFHYGQKNPYLPGNVHVEGEGFIEPGHFRRRNAAEYAVGQFSQGSDGQPTTCNFVHKTGRRNPYAHHHCGSNIRRAGSCEWHGQTVRSTIEALPAIGNEAYVCTAEHSNERVIGRVRDQVFSIRIGTTTKGESAVWLADLKTTIAIAAEQVSGNLF
jgi:hypothetical protein